MAFKVQLYTFSKRDNSTKIPDSNTPTFEFDCVFKAPSAIINPTLELRLSLAANPAIYNYARIELFRRYYFITEWRWNGGLWEADLAVDVLASWRTEIGNSAEYISRSSAAFDGEITDSAYPLTNNIERVVVEAASPWNLSGIKTSGDFVIAIQGYTTDYYAMSWPQLDYMLNGVDGLFSDDYAHSVVGGWASVYPELKARLNPLQYIQSCRWYPFVLPASEVDEVQSIPIGWGEVTATVAKITSNGVKTGSLTFNIPRHPQAATRGAYLNAPPYADYTLYIPPFPIVQLDGNLAKDATSIRADWQVDLHTGDGLLKVWYVGGGDADILAGTAAAKVGVEFALGQILDAVPGVTTLLLGGGVGNAAASLATQTKSNLAAHASTATLVAGAALGVASIAESMAGKVAAGKVPMFSAVGMTGGVSNLMGTPRLQCEFYEIAAEDLEHIGRPLMQKRRVSSLPGFMQIINPSVIAPATEGEAVAIRQQMAAGFFYE